MHVVSPDPIPTTLRTWKPGARKPRIPDQASPKPRRGDESGPGRSERVAAWNAAAQVLAVRAAEERKLSMPKAALHWRSIFHSTRMSGVVGIVSVADAISRVGATARVS